MILTVVLGWLLAFGIVWALLYAQGDRNRND